MRKENEIDVSDAKKKWKEMNQSLVVKDESAENKNILHYNIPKSVNIRDS